MMKVVLVMPLHTYRTMRIKSLYDESCTGYADAYFNAQCEADALYDVDVQDMSKHTLINNVCIITI